MKIAIATDKQGLDSPVSEVGGRAKFYQIFEDKKLVKEIKNPFRVGGGGVGFSVAALMAEEKVDLIISGHIGDNMAGALEDKGIKYKIVTNKTVKGAIEEKV